MPRARVEAIPHDCLHCGQPLVPHPGECPASFNTRRFCNRFCGARSPRIGRPPNRDDHANALDHVSVPVEIQFPGAKAETLAEAPAKCTCGADWVVDEGGLACRMCGRRLYVVSELRRTIGRYGFGPAAEKSGRRGSSLPRGRSWRDALSPRCETLQSAR